MGIDFTTLFQQIQLPVVLKYLYLFMVGLFFLFTLFLLNQIRSLNRIISYPSSDKTIIWIISLFFVIATLFLFLFALAIL